MDARATRAGGRHEAAERGAFDSARLWVIEQEPQPVGGPLIERLSAESLAAVAEAVGLSVAELLERETQ